MLLIAPLTSLVQAAVPESAYADLSWRLLGPFRGGWVTAVAGHPDRRETFYFGSADGGVWRTDNAGATWQPLFERGGSASIVDLLEGMNVYHAVVEAGHTITTLVGEIRDQAALAGVLNTLYELHLPVLMVMRLNI